VIEQELCQWNAGQPGARGCFHAPTATMLHCYGANPSRPMFHFGAWPRVEAKLEVARTIADVFDLDQILQEPPPTIIVRR
jgi:hypothetical protein